MRNRDLLILLGLVLCSAVGSIAHAQPESAKGNKDIAVELGAQRGRIGWRGPIEEWYWLIGNPRRIGPNFFFGDDPFIDAAIRVNAQTRSTLYDGTPPALRYQKGKRPVLEEIVARVTAGCKTDAERANALVKWVYALRVDPKAQKGRFAPVLPAQLPANPHAEEHIIKDGAGSCEWVTRLFVALAQVADLPTRLVMRRVHTQAEVYVDGRWLLFCPLMGDHGERFLSQPAGVFAGKSALQVYDAKDTRQEIAIARYYLGEERQTRWLKLDPAPNKGGLKVPLLGAKPDLVPKLELGNEHWQPIAQPGPPEPLYMVSPKWSVAKNRLRVDFAPGLFFHLNQAVAGADDGKDASVFVTVLREPRAQDAAGLAGVVFRSRGQNYNAVLLQDEHSVLVMRIEEGWKTRVLARFPRPLARDGVAHLYVYCQDDTARVWLDDRYLGSVSEGLWPAGKVGVAAVQTASFADFKVWLKPAAPPLPAQSTVMVHSEELRLSDVLEWDRLLLDVPVPSRQCQPEYSIDSGKTWQAVASDHALGEVDPRAGRIRFRFKLPPDSSARLGVVYRTSPDLRPAPQK